MDSATLKMASSIIVRPNASAILAPKEIVNYGIKSKGSVFNTKICAIPPNGSASCGALHGVSQF